MSKEQSCLPTYLLVNVDIAKVFGIELAGVFGAIQTFCGSDCSAMIWDSQLSGGLLGFMKPTRIRNKIGILGHWGIVSVDDIRKVGEGKEKDTLRGYEIYPERLDEILEAYLAELSNLRKEK